MKFLVIGYGSIGRRHARNLAALGQEVVLLRHAAGNVNPDGYKEYYSLDAAVKAEGRYDGAVVCSPNSNHLADIKALLEHRIPFLAEKPPTHDLASALELASALSRPENAKYDFAFNLRYYPLLRFIKDYLPNLGAIYAARVQAGSYLPGWRKNVDYRRTSSASKELGGGVHLELIHEIDYILWLFGRPARVFSSIDKVSDLEISTDDLCASLFKYGNGSVVELHLDYLSHQPLRTCQIIAANGTLEADLNAGRAVYYDKSGGAPQELFVLPDGPKFDETYLAELENFFRIIAGQGTAVVDIAAAVDTMRVVTAMESSAQKGSWETL